MLSPALPLHPEYLHFAGHWCWDLLAFQRSVCCFSLLYYLFAPFSVHFETLKTLSHLGMLPSTSSGVALPESGCCFHRAPKSRRAWQSGHHPAWRNKSPFLAHKRSVFLAPQCPAPSVCSQHSWPRFVEGTAEAW